MAGNTRFGWLAAMLVLGASAARADHQASNLSQTIGGPIVTIPASTLPAGRWALSMRVEYLRLRRLSDQELLDEGSIGHHVHSMDALLAPSVSLAYGLTDRITIGASLPRVSRRGLREAHLEGTTTELHDHGTAEGLGDLTLLGQYRLTRDEIQEFALLVGVKTPTGETDVADEGVPLEVDDQPGSGSWDPLLGAAWTEQTTSGSVDANVLVRLTTTGHEEINLGQVLQFNFAVSNLVYSSRERVEGEAATTRIHLLGEANLERHEPQQEAGVDVVNTGGTVVYLAPGVRLSSRERWSLGVSVGVPVLRELNGKQSDADLRVVASLGVQL